MFYKYLCILSKICLEITSYYLIYKRVDGNFMIIDIRFYIALLSLFFKKKVSEVLSQI